MTLPTSAGSTTSSVRQGGKNSKMVFEYVERMTERMLATQSNHCLTGYLFHNFMGDVTKKGGLYHIMLEPEVAVGEGLNIIVSENSDAATSQIIERHATLRVLPMKHVAFEGIDALETTLQFDPARWDDWYATSGINLGHHLDFQGWNVYNHGCGLTFGSVSNLISPRAIGIAEATLQSVPLPVNSKRVVCVMDHLRLEAMRGAFGGPIVQDDEKGSGAAPIGDEMYLKPLSMKAAYAGVKIYGHIPVFITENLPPYSPGTWAGTPQMMGANQKGTSIETDGWTSGDKLNAGAAFTIAGVGFVNQKNKDNVIMEKATFTVTEDATANAQGQMTINISPEIIFNNDFASLDANRSVNTKVYDNVNKLADDNALLTIIGTSGNQYPQAFVFNEMGIYRRGVEMNRLVIGKNDPRESLKRMYMKRSAGGGRGLMFSIHCYSETDGKRGQSYLVFRSLQACSVIRPMYLARVVGTNDLPQLASLSVA